MPNHEPNFITAIDVGSAKTSVLVAELSDNGLRYRGHGVTESSAAKTLRAPGTRAPPKVGSK